MKSLWESINFKKKSDFRNGICLFSPVVNIHLKVSAVVLCPCKISQTALIYILVGISSGAPVNGHHDGIRNARDLLGEGHGRDAGEGRVRQGVALGWTACLIPVKGVGEGRMIWLNDLVGRAKACSASPRMRW